MIRHEQKRTQWRALVAKFEGSGTSQAEFAALAGVALAAFRHWLYKLRAESGGRSTARSGRRPLTAAMGLRLPPIDVQRAPATATRCAPGARPSGVDLTGSTRSRRRAPARIDNPQIRKLPRKRLGSTVLQRTALAHRP